VTNGSEDEGEGGGGRLARRVSRVRERATLLAEQMERRRPSSTTLDVGLTLYERDRRFLGGLMAGALAFRLFIFLVPFSLVTVIGLDLFVALDPDNASRFVDEIGLRALLVGDVLETGGSVRGGVIAALVLGLGASLYASYGVVRALWLVHAAAWGLGGRRPPRPAVGALVFLGVNVLLLVVPFGLAWLREEAAGPGLTATMAAVVLYAGIWWLASLALPHAGAPALALLPGALLVAVGAQVLHLATVFYLAGRLERYENVYGAIGAAAVVLVWLYVIARLLVGSATLNAVIAERRLD
jgi:uncharacterized BrkB/YihY/UPF0761 family membrane protein